MVDRPGVGYIYNGPNEEVAFMNKTILVAAGIMLLSGCSSTLSFVNWPEVCKTEAEAVEKVCLRFGTPETCAALKLNAEAKCLERHQ